MKDKHIADIFAWIHLAWILFGIASLPLLFLIPGWNTVVLAFIGVTVVSWIVFRGCWFLQLENLYRKRHDPKEAFGEETFIQHYLKRVFKIVVPRLYLRLFIYGYMSVLAVLSVAVR